MANVLFFFGVMGVGKSTIVDALENRLPNSIVLHASQILCEALGYINRQDIEHISPETRLEIMVEKLIKIFDSVSHYQYVLFDTHLMVPVIKDGYTIYEDVWHDSYEKYAQGLFYISADPRIIQKRRIKDVMRYGRIRDINLEKIIEENRVNYERFQSLVFCNTKIEITNNRSLLDTLSKTEEWLIKI